MLNELNFYLQTASGFSKQRSVTTMFLQLGLPTFNNTSARLCFNFYKQAESLWYTESQWYTDVSFNVYAYICDSYFYTALYRVESGELPDYDEYCNTRIW